MKIERDLMRLVPREDWARFPHLLIWHGRRICDARQPLCEECPLAPTSACRAASTPRLGVSATSRPPSSSYAGKTSATTRFSLPARVRIESCSPRRRTPHSRASSTGLRVGELQRLDDVAAHQVGLREPRQLEDAAADREHAALLVGDDACRCRAPGSSRRAARRGSRTRSAGRRAPASRIPRVASMSTERSLQCGQM